MKCEHCDKTEFTEFDPLFIGKDAFGKEHKYCKACLIKSHRPKANPFNIGLAEWEQRKNRYGIGNVL